jgi:hypothetical protein
MAVRIMAQIHIIMVCINLGAALAAPLFTTVVPMFNVINAHEESRLLKSLKFLTFLYLLSTMGIAILGQTGMEMLLDSYLRRWTIVGFTLQVIFKGITSPTFICRNSTTLMLIFLFTSLLVSSCSLEYFSLISQR